MQVVEEEFRHTAAGLGCTGAEANALAHQWTSPEGLGPHPPSSNPEAFDDSAHSRADTFKHGQQSCLLHDCFTQGAVTCTECQWAVAAVLD